jgi:hypothetical protein
MPHGGAPKAGLTGKAVDRAIINISAIPVPAFTHVFRWQLFELLRGLQLVAHLADRRLDGVHVSLRGIGAQGRASGRHKHNSGSQRDAGALPRKVHSNTPASSKPLLRTAIIVPQVHGCTDGRGLVPEQALRALCPFSLQNVTLVAILRWLVDVNPPKSGTPVASVNCDYFHVSVKRY